MFRKVRNKLPLTRRRISEERKNQPLRCKKENRDISDPVGRSAKEAGSWLLTLQDKLQVTPWKVGNQLLVPTFAT
jgi:hypothetical protein